ncbi:hypothetical protein AVEN_258509-1 [Araneus ventricosus]|uniref:Uncharacterized protein n=1 Tax=Araneus ventricosus TaxID=182803 RepID=A0A4Y2H0K2_ARAVE|nr:hypothetical protein AVEN_258509-1 [Araneus ventricosus]
MGDAGGQVTLDDISRHHKLSYETKIVEIGLVVGAGGFLQGLPIDNEQRRIFFSISIENGSGVGQSTLHYKSRRHKLSYNTKIVEIRRVVVAGEMSKGFRP